MIRVVILASGGGSNAAALMEHFKNHPQIRIVGLWTDKMHCGARSLAQQKGVEDRFLESGFWSDETRMKALIQEQSVDFFLLAGFLKLVPEYLVKQFPNRILNIHPALLPDFGGKGMFGMHIHRAVIAAGKTQSGLTIHLVNERFDEGKILFQKTVEFDSGTTPETLQQIILKEEHRWYPVIAEQYILSF